MFSGITQNTSTVRSSEAHGGAVTIRIHTPRGWKLSPGQSVLVDGVCSTIMKRTAAFFEVQYVPETLSKTTVGSFALGTRVNLERSLTLNEYVDGHLVAGHVDARGRVTGAKKGIVSVMVPTSLMRFVAKKGSIALNGVALTVVSRSSDSFSVAIIPYTAAHTNLGSLKIADEVNVEIDLIARYLDALGKKR